jgi:poly(A) polymerase
MALDSKAPSSSPEYLAAMSVARTIRCAGHQAYFAGGCVRDLLLGRIPKDFDVATSATPDEVMALFPKTKSVGAHFGVILVSSSAAYNTEQEECAFDIEVATFRNDGIYTDGRRPDAVRFSDDPKEDVVRRDFTINGMLLDPIAFDESSDLEASVRDFVGGRADLEAKVIRAIGDPAIRFAEDKLRMLRAIRFAARLGFQIDPTTMAAIRAQAASITKVSTERIASELTMMLTEGHARRAFELLDESGLLVYVLPEAVKLKGVEQPPQYHPEGDVWIHTMLLLEKLPAEVSPTLAWAALLHDIGKPATFTAPKPGVTGDRIRFNNHVEVGVRMSEVILHRLRFSNEDAEQIIALVKNHMRFGDILNMRQATLKRFVRMPKFEEHLELHRMDVLSSNGKLELYEFARKNFRDDPDEAARPKPFVSGRDLIVAGYRPGVQFKEMLEFAEDAQLDGVVTTRAEALAALRERFGAPPQAFTTLTSA